MDELVQIMQQRNSDLQNLKNGNHTNLNLYLNKQKQRCHKQNWVLKVLKSIKLLTSQLKTDIYYKSQTMMNHLSIVKMNKNQNIEEHFTQKLINLYIDFFNQVSAMDNNFQYNPIKSVIRPNNSYIITDLLKSLIQIQRKKYRQIYIQSNNTIDNEIKSYRKKLALDLMLQNQKQAGLNKQSQNQANKSKRKTPYNPKNLISKCNKQKYTNFIKSIDIKQLQKRVNEQFLEIKQKNQKNSYLIEKFRYKCLGAASQKNTDYDLTSLYTKQQILQIKQKIRLQALEKEQKQAENPQNLNQCLGQEDNLLKEKSIKQLIKTQNLYSLQRKNTKNYCQVQKWFPLMICKKPSKENPWEICLLKNKYKIKSNQILEDPEISVIGLKEYLIQKLKEFFPVNDKYLTVTIDQNDFKMIFDKRSFIDYGRKKQFEVVQGDRVLLRKELLFPTLKQNQLKELNANLKKPQITIRKSKSQQKFLPRFQKFLNSTQPTLSQQTSLKTHQSYSLQKKNLVFQNNLDLSPRGIKPIQKQVLISIKRPSINIKIRKNSIEQILNEKILQRKMEIQEQNKVYQNRIKLLFGTQNQKNTLMKNKFRKNKTSLLGISSSIAGMEHFLL